MLKMKLRGIKMHNVEHVLVSIPEEINDVIREFLISSLCNNEDDRDIPLADMLASPEKEYGGYKLPIVKLFEDCLLEFLETGDIQCIDAESIKELHAPLVKEIDGQISDSDWSVGHIDRLSVTSIPYLYILTIE